MKRRMPVQVVWVYGAPGVGKSTTAWQLYCDLSDSGLVCGYVDIDQLGMWYPALAQDLGRHLLKGRALASVVPNYAAADAGVLVVSGVLDPDLADWYVAELDGVEATFVRLTVDDRELWRRHQERGATAEDFEIVRREARVLDAARLAHSTVETAGLSPREVAAAVRAQLGAAAMTPTAAGTAPPPLTPFGSLGVGRWRRHAVAWSFLALLLRVPLTGSSPAAARVRRRLQRCDEPPATGSQRRLAVELLQRDRRLPLSSSGPWRCEQVTSPRSAAVLLEQ